MTSAVAQSIGGLMDTIMKVDTFVSKDCIDRFLRVKIRFNVREPLMKDTFISFPDDGTVWVDFKYEYLPKYCLICGVLGHSTRVCKELNIEGDYMESKKAQEGMYAFKGLDAEFDLRGKSLDYGFRKSGFVG